MINSHAYDYIDVLDKAADASWKREQLITNNIANVDTPGYKRQDLDFESTLKQELGKSQYVTLDDKIKNTNLNNLEAETYTDYAGFSYREDKNNVDIDTENVELASEQLRYNAISNSLTNELNRLKSVIS
ncbi:MAG: flagellar basal body rod protein FlgB [Lachnospiraceae bacterium]|nr:flagellar basal body rod protein FlgB [Lachnospiraceae bacterium]